jgi:hypothetical protein
MTAEQYILENFEVNHADKDIQKAMIGFAKYHVEEALKEALDSIPCLGSSTDIATYEEVENAVLNAYPLENIK